MKKINHLFLALGIVFAVVITGSGQAYAQTPTPTNNTCRWFQGTPPAGCPGSQQLDQKSGNKEPYIQTLVSAFIWAAGALSLLFLLIGSIRYITASGNSARIQQAKDTVLYSIIGLIVVALAIPISGYVIGMFS